MQLYNVQKHYLSADDTRLFFFFHPRWLTNYDSSITRLQKCSLTDDCKSFNWNAFSCHHYLPLSWFKTASTTATSNIHPNLTIVILLPFP